MIEGKSIERLVPSQTVIQELFEVLLKSCPEGGYIHWGFNEPKKDQIPELPSREEVSRLAVGRARSRAANELLDQGRVFSMSFDGILPDDMKVLAKEFLDKGYAVWRRIKAMSGSSEFYISGHTEDSYLQEYFKQITTTDDPDLIRGIKS